MDIDMIFRLTPFKITIDVSFINTVESRTHITDIYRVRKTLCTCSYVIINKSFQRFSGELPANAWDETTRYTYCDTRKAQ